MMRPCSFLFLLAMTLHVASAALPEFTGFSVEDNNARFILVNPETAASSQWLSLGQEFEGYTLKTFRAGADTIVLSKNGIDYPVRLRRMKTRNESKESSQAVAEAEVVYRRLKEISLQLSTYCIEKGVSYATADELRKFLALKKREKLLDSLFGETYPERFDVRATEISAVMRDGKFVKFSQ